MTENEFTYWAFLSHSQQDNCGKRETAPDECSLCWGDWLLAELKNFSIPAVFAGQINARGETIPDRIDPVFHDQEEQPENARLSDRVRRALEESKCLIVICSPRSAKSLQVNEQVRYFKQLGRGNRILPFVIAGEPNACDGSKPGKSPEDECFVPGLRHPIMPDGTLDTSRRERYSIFADARHGDARQEILAKDHQEAEIELETAKIQLIAGLIGVGFNGLWAHELKRRFAAAHLLGRSGRAQNQEGGSPDQEAENQLLEARRQAREALGQVVEARNQVEAAEAKVLEARQLAREAQNQLAEARHQMGEVQNQALAAPSLPPAMDGRTEEGQNQLQEAQNQAREAQNQAEAARQHARELENKFQESQNQCSQAQSRIQEIEEQIRHTQQELEMAQKQADVAEANTLETQQQVRETEEQLAAVRRELREAQHQVLEVQNLPQDVKRRIEDVQVEIQEAQELETKVVESQSQADLAHRQVRELEDEARQTLNQLAEAQSQAKAAESKVLEKQQQIRDTESKLAEAHQKTVEFETKFQDSQAQAARAQSQVRKIEDQARQTESQLAEAQSQAKAAEGRVLDAQQQLRDALTQLETLQRQARELEKNFQESQNQVRQSQLQLSETQIEVEAAKAKTLEAQHKIQEIEGQNQAAQAQIQAVLGQASEAQSQVRKTKDQVLELQNKNLAARRRTQVLAVLTVLALIAAGTSILPRPPASPPPAAELKPEVAHGPLNREQIQQALQKVSAGGGEENRLSTLEDLATRVPAEEISNTLDMASSYLAGPALSQFQELLLDCWMKTNLPATFDWSCQLADTNSRQRALDKIMPALRADSFTNTLARLNELQPAPDEDTYRLLFQNWAATAPVQAIEQWQHLPAPDAGDKILSAILLVWVDQQPAAALNWLESQPDSESVPAGTWRNSMLAGMFNAWAAKDLEAATIACQQLPDGPAKEKAWENVLSQRIVQAPASAADWVANLVAGDHRQEAIAELCRYWGATNAHAALAWAPTLPTVDERITATNQILASWAGKDPQAAAQFAGQHPELSGAVLGDLVSAWSQRDLSATTNWVARLPEGEKKDTVRLALASATTERAPMLAAQLCTLVTTNQPTTVQVQDIAASLAKVDLTNAVAWARSLKDYSMQQAALAALAEPWAESDPQDMATYAVGLVPGDDQTRLLTIACRQLAKRDLPGMVELLKPLLDEGLRQNILEQAGRDCDLLRLDQVSKYIATLPAGDDQKAAIKGLVASWTATDPEAALNWLVAFPETNAQPEQVQRVLTAWAQLEPAAAAKWLTNSPAGMPGDDLESAFLQGALVKYPAYAAAWIESVTNETQRQTFQLQVARQWLKTDASAATNWIDSLNIPEAGRQSLKAQ